MYISMAHFIEQCQKNASEISFKGDWQTRSFAVIQKRLFYGLRRKAGITGLGTGDFCFKGKKAVYFENSSAIGGMNAFYKAS